MVYFRKSTGAIKGPWSMGLVDSLERGRDNIVRQVTVRYFNASEPNIPHLTDRSVRSLVRLFHLDEINWSDDLDRVRKICEETNLPLTSNTQSSTNMCEETSTDKEPLDCSCCCTAHHSICDSSDEPLYSYALYSSITVPPPVPLSIPALQYPEVDRFLDSAGDTDTFVNSYDIFNGHLLSLGHLPGQVTH